VKSAYEDLSRFTLGRIAGTWGKLAYLAGRRTSDGEYEHWGFVRTHGESEAQEAFLEAHHSILAIILRTPLGTLRKDLQESSAAEEVTTSSYVSRLCLEPERLLPSDCSKMTERHLIYLLQTLSMIENRKERNLQSALPSLQPDR
jgi:hypothetical protein